MAETHSRIRVLLERDLDDNPRCLHGPMLRFSRESETKGRREFFGCSACRNAKECGGGFPGKEKDYQVANLKVHREAFERSRVNSSRFYCSSCNLLCKDTCGHGSCSLQEISESDLAHPTRILAPNSRDKTEAQYFFDDATVDQILTILKDLNINKTICLGTPRLHEHIKQLPDFKSILLDFDSRLAHFYPPEEFLRYNMFNHYFFCGEYSSTIFSKFLKKDFRRDKVCLLVDPPFGCRTEALSYTLKKIQLEYLTLNMEILPVFWVFPYFMERYVTKAMPEMTMLDYKVSYTNHRTYNEAGRFGSPVRLYTNVIPKLVQFRKGFKFCAKCQLFRRIENVHCDKCNTCPSKNGAVYKHCPSCLTCVKPYYVHCIDCNRCAQSEGHDCIEYQGNAFCWVCDEKGHVEKHCPLTLTRPMKAAKGKGRNLSRICVICRKSNHNERQCRAKESLLNQK